MVEQQGPLTTTPSVRPAIRSLLMLQNTITLKAADYDALQAELALLRQQVCAYSAESSSQTHHSSHRGSRDAVAAAEPDHNSRTTVRPTHRSLGMLNRFQRLAANGLGILYQFRLSPEGVPSFPYISESCRPRLGLEPAAIMQDATQLLDLIPPEEREPFQASVARSAATLEPWCWEGRLILPTARVLWIKAESWPEAQPDGSITWDGWMLDVTDYKQATLELQAAGDRLTTILNGASDAFFALDRHWCFTHVNHHAETLLGQRAEALIGHNLWELFPEAVGSTFEQQYRYAAEQGQAVTFEEYYPPLETWFEVRAYPVAGELFVYFTDVSDRKNLEQSYQQVADLKEQLEVRVAERTAELERTTAEMTAILNNAPAVIYAKDLEGRYLLLNRQYENLFQIKQSEVLGRTDDAIFPAPVAATVRANDQKVIATGQALSSEETVPHQDGSLHTYISHKFPLLDKTGRIYAVCGISTDITDRLEAEATQRKLAALIENSPDFIGLADLEGKAQYINPAGLALVGLPNLEAAVSMTMADFSPPEYHSYFANEILPAIQERGAWQGENYFQHFETGEILPVETNLFLVRHPETQEPLCFATVTRDVRERQQAEQALRDSERRYQTLAEVSPIGVYYSDTEGNCLYANRFLSTLVGYGPEVMLGSGWFQAVHPEDREAMFVEWNRTAALGKPFRLEHRFQRPDGEALWAINQAAPVILESGEIEGFVGTITDITERKQAEAQLQATKEELENFFTVALDLLCIADLEGHFLRVNRAWEKVLGYTTESLEGQVFLDFVHPDDIEATLASIAALGVGETVTSFVNRYRCQDGSYRYIEWRSSPCGNRIYAAARDITERRQVEQELLVYKQALDSATDAIAIADPQGRQRYQNAAFSALYGVATPEAFNAWGGIPQAFADPGVVQEMLQSLSREQPWSGEAELNRAHGPTFPGLVRANCIRDPQGEIIGLLGVMTDITARKEAEAVLRQQTQELEQALRELRTTQAHLIQSEKMSGLGQLVAGIAHEINNPVNFIYGNLVHTQEYAENLLEVVQAYQQHYPDPVEELEDLIEELDLDFTLKDFPRLIDSMKLGAQRIRDIVTSLRTFSRLDEAECKEADVHEGLESTLLILQNRLKAKSDRPAIEVVKDYGPRALVECYPSQLNQVFMNIVANALDAMEERDEGRSPHAKKAEPSTIRITTQEEQPGWLTIRIQDNGPGIPEAVQQRLFDPFFTTKPTGKGTGLGMSISYQIITERHGGTLTCASEPGQGAEFAITIPVHQPKAKG